MKLQPSNDHERLRLASVPFKTYIVGAALIYHHYRPLMPGSPGVIGGGALTDWMTNLSLGYYVSFIALLIIAFLQKSAGHRWGAIWSFIFALAALCGGVTLYPPY